MNGIDFNELIIFNNIIYKIYSLDNFDEMRKQVLIDLKFIVDYDAADFYLSSGNGSFHLSEPVTYKIHDDVAKQYENIDYSRGIMQTGKSMVYRETDILADEKRVLTDYYIKVYQPNSWHYAMQMILCFDDEFLGVATFYRKKGKKDFEYQDVFLLNSIKEHLALRLSKQSMKKAEMVNYTDVVDKYKLTRRESEILQLIIEGNENYQICEKIVITNNTLKKHVLNIYKKMGIKNRVQLVKKVMQEE